MRHVHRIARPAHGPAAANGCCDCVEAKDVSTCRAKGICPAGVFVCAAEQEPLELLP